MVHTLGRAFVTLNNMRVNMYQDKGFVMLIVGSVLTAAGSFLTSIFTGMAPILGFITRSDVTFVITCAAGLTTIVAGLIKARRDWKEGRMKLPWNKNPNKRKRA